MRKLLSYLLIILTWLFFGYYYFSLYEKERTAHVPEAEADATAEVNQGMALQLLPDGRSIRPDMLCLNTSAADDPPWSNPALQNAIQELNVRRFRIPGGSVAGYWQWQSGEILPDGERAEPLLRETSLERYLEGLTATESRPILVLNMLTADLPNQLEMLRAVEAAGIPVDFVELGYGWYEGGPDSDYGRAFPDGEAYAETAESWAAAVRAEFPAAAVGLVAAPPSGSGERAAGWNAAVFALAQAQGLAVSFYPLPLRGLEPGQTLNEDNLALVLGWPFQLWQNYSRGDSAPLAALPAGVPVWMMEYNVPREAEGEPQAAEKWAQSLYILAQSLLFLEDERVELMCPSLLTGPRNWAALLRHGDRFDLMPTGRAVQILGRAMNGMTNARPMAFVNVPPAEGRDYPPMVGWQFSDGSGRQTAVVLNLSADRRELRVTDLPAGFPRQYQQLLGDPTRRVRNNEGVEVVSGDFTDRNFVMFLPYSVTIFTAR